MSTEEDRRFLLVIDYEGPWDKLQGFFYGIRRNGQGLRWEIPEDPVCWRAVLGRAGDFCDRRNQAWLSRHARQGTKPHRWWKRKTG